MAAHFHDGSVESTAIDPENWSDSFEPVLSENPGLAEDFARLLSIIKDSAESDGFDADRVTRALDSAIHLLFPYTSVYKSARELWMLSLQGVLEWNNEPAQLLRPAIDQGRNVIERIRCRERDQLA